MSLTASTRTANSTGASTSSSTVRMGSLHGNLLRTHRKRDPMKIYEVIEMLGEGSMGSVARVRKKEEAVGGSARPKFVQKHGNQNCCFNLFSFLPTFRLQNDLIVMSSSTAAMDSDSLNDSESNVKSNSSSSKPSNRKTFIRKQSSLITYGSKKETAYALKSIHLDRCSSLELRDELKNEIEILKNLDHANIVRAIETYDFRNRMYLLLELCSGGDLYSRDPYNEDTAKSIIRDLLSAVSYLHSQEIVHRDLKFENIMFVSPRSDQIRLIDFGLSKKYASDEHLHDAVGTVYTMAPELIRGSYDAKADVWSVGVIAFMLLSSSMPFYGKDRVQVIKKILKGKYSFASRRWKQVSEEAMSFVRDLLVNVEDRPTSDDAYRSPWLEVVPDQYHSETDLMRMDEIQATMQAFAGYSKLKKLALMVIAFKSTSEEIGYLRSMFLKFDKVKNGEISLEEFKAALSEYYDYSDEEIEELFNGIDIDGTGSIHYMEFLAATLEAHGSIDEQRLAEAFDRIDSDDSGYITVGNLRDFLGEDLPEEYLSGIIDEADILKDKRISYEEFLALWDDEGDRRRASSKLLVQSKKKFGSEGRQDSISEVSSTLTDDFVDDHIEGSESPIKPIPSQFYFAKQKEQSVRGVAWV